MNRISEYQKNAAQCLKLAESSNERDRRAFVQMAEDWRVLAEKVRQREATPGEQQPRVAVWPKNPEPQDPPLRQKRPPEESADNCSDGNLEVSIIAGSRCPLRICAPCSAPSRPRATVNKLETLREPGESHSDVILRLVEIEAKSRRLSLPQP